MREARQATELPVCEPDGQASWPARPGRLPTGWVGCVGGCCGAYSLQWCCCRRRRHHPATSNASPGCWPAGQGGVQLARHLAVQQAVGQGQGEVAAAHAGLHVPAVGPRVIFHVWCAFSLGLLARNLTRGPRSVPPPYQGKAYVAELPPSKTLDTLANASWLASAYPTWSRTTTLLPHGPEPASVLSTLGSSLLEPAACHVPPCPQELCKRGFSSIKGPHYTGARKTPWHMSLGTAA